MPVFNNILAGAAGSGGAAGYTIERSLRFNQGDSPSLSKSFGSAGNRKKWTWSGWFKLGSTSQPGRLFSAGADATNRTNIFYYPRSNNLGIGFYSYVGGSLVGQAGTTAVLADHSAWYHLVFAFDAANSTTADRLKIYINGVELAISYTVNVSDVEHLVNNNIAHYVGRGADGYSFDGYLADVHFIDDQALAASDFGDPDDNGVWQPKRYSGTYGTNGFHLDFSDNSSNAALGTDAAGSNDWTVNNLVADATADYAATGSDPNSKLNSGTYQDFWDGSTSNYLTLLQGGYVVMADFGSNPIGTATTNVGFYTHNGASTATLRINGTTVFEADSTTLAWYDFNFTGAVYKVEIGYLGGSGSANNFYAFRIDGTTIVGGPASGIDSLIDTPTNYTAASGNNGGNYPTWNPLSQSSSTFSDGNLQATTSGGSGYPLETVNFYTPPGTGKWYWEFQLSALSGSNFTMVGMLPRDNTYVQGNSNIPTEAGGIQVYIGSNGAVTAASGAATAGTATATFGVGDILGWAFDAENGTVKCYKNGVAQGTQFTNVRTDVGWAFCVTDYDNSATATYIINYGQRPFAISSVPTGYVSLCTTNLPDPTIADGSTAFDIITYSGDGTSSRNLTLPLAADLVWIKKRSAATSHHLADTVRGDDAVLKSNSTDEEKNPQTEFSGGGISSISNTTVTIKEGTSNNDNQNALNATYVGWLWDAGTSTASNTNGSITSSVRANASAGFSIVSWTGNGTSGSTVGHGLNAAPKMIIFKNRDTAGTNWRVYNTMVDGSLDFVYLNTTAAKSDSGLSLPTSTVFTAGGSDDTNGNGDAMINYCFAPVEGYSSFGSYTANAVLDGPFVFTGFKPKWIMLKHATGTANTYSSWLIVDTERDTYNVSDAGLFANHAAIEGTRGDEAGTAGTWVDILSNGFKIRYNGTEVNGTAGDTYIYAAFAEHPFKTARAR